MRYKKYINKNGGFTLFEMIVALAIFTVVMMISIGAILNIMNVQKRSLGVRSLQDNLNFAIDTMTREIIEGDNYRTISGNDFTFDNSNGLTVIYSLVDGQLTRRQDSDPAQSLTDPKTSITNLKFTTNGTGVNDNAQPMVVINIEASVSINSDIAVSMVMQSVVSQRIPDFVDLYNL